MHSWIFRFIQVVSAVQSRSEEIGEVKGLLSKKRCSSSLSESSFFLNMHLIILDVFLKVLPEVLVRDRVGRVSEVRWLMGSSFL